MKKTLILFVALPLVFASCKKEGCMDENATNYDADAKKEGPCDYASPTITVTGNNPDTVEVGSTYNDAGATATDFDGSTITVDADISAVNTSEVGSFSVTYTAVGTHGTTTATRDVSVVIGQAAWLGTWTLNTTCDAIQFPLAADPTITAGSGSNDIVIDNFFTLVGGTAYGTIDGQNITFAQQTINIQFGDITFEGTGSMNNMANTINIDWAYDNTTPGIGGIGSCQSTYTK